MKKIFLSLFTLLFFLTPIFSQNLDNLYGIWEGKDRFVFIEPGENNETEIVILLKDFYGWYYDRVAEPEKYSESHSRTRNSATPRNAEHVTLAVQPINKSSLKNTYELILNYTKNQKSIVPIVIIDNNMFLDFYVQDIEDKNFYRGVAQSKGIMASEQAVNKNLTSYYVTPDLIYNIRYWITDMDYTDEKVSLKVGENNFQVDKHIKSGNNIYTNVAGRRKIIRNPYEPEPLSEKYYFTEDKTILLTDTTPYLTRLADKNTFDQLMEIVKKANSRRKPAPHELFPDSNVDFYWEIIDYLEKDVKIIQEVRERQRLFGPRGKDIGN